MTLLSDMSQLAGADAADAADAVESVPVPNSSSEPSRFLALPIEIRLEIYRLVCGEQIRAFLKPLPQKRNGHRPFLIPGSTSALRRYNKSGQICRACKQIDDEARPILYSTTDLHLRFARREFCLPTVFDECFGNAEYIRRIVYDILAAELSWDSFCLFVAQEWRGIEVLEIRFNFNTLWSSDWTIKQKLLLESEGRDVLRLYGKMLFRRGKTASEPIFKRLVQRHCTYQGGKYMDRQTITIMLTKDKLPLEEAVNSNATAVSSKIADP